MRAFFVFFCVFLLKSLKSKKTFPQCTLQLRVIKIGGSGGGSKSRSRCVFGCANGAGVGEIALVIFHYSIIFRISLGLFSVSLAPFRARLKERCASAAGEGFGGPCPETFTRSHRRKRSGALGLKGFLHGPLSPKFPGVEVGE